MIDFHSLRIDNWILDNGNPVQVYMLSKGMNFYCINGVNLDKKTGREYLGFAMNSHRPHENIISDKDRFSPIELTPEIIKDCRFLPLPFGSTSSCLIVNNYIGIVHHQSGILSLTTMVSNDGEYPQKTDVTLSHLQYLHQLQNLYFDLTQTELSYHPSTISEKTE